MSDLAPLPTGRPTRLVFLGTPEVAVRPLAALLDAGFDVVMVVTGVDKRRGRGSERAPSPVKQFAEQHGIPVGHEVAHVLDIGAELGVVVAFGKLIKPTVLAQMPMVNLHFSLLPRWRGAAPVERAILAGDPTTGVCLMQLEQGLDTGPVLDAASMPIGEHQSLDELRSELADLGSDLLVRNLRAGLGIASPQVGEPTYAHKLEPSEFEINWTWPSIDIDRLVRLGRAWTTFRGKRLRVLDARSIDGVETDFGPGALIDAQTVACSSGALRLVTVQPEARPAMDVASWRNGSQPRPGELLGQSS